MNKIINVEKTFYSKQEELSSVEEKLKRSKDFYVWLQKQYPKGEDYEPERQALLQVEYRLYWYCINEVIQANKRDEKIIFNKLTDCWDSSLTKSLYEYIGWYRTNISKKGGLMTVNNEVQQQFAVLTAKMTKAAGEADYFQMLYIYFQMHLNGILNFKEIAYPPKAKKSVKRKPDGDEPFLGGDRDMELFKSEDKQPVFWYCRDRRNVTLQQCIDEKLDLRLLCWPKNSDGHQDFTAVLPPLSYTKESKESVTWEHTYKGETLRSIEERLFPQPSFEEEEEVIGVNANGEEIKRDVADEVDLTFLNIQDGKDLLKG